MDPEILRTCYTSPVANWRENMRPERYWLEYAANYIQSIIDKVGPRLEIKIR